MLLTQQVFDKLTFICTHRYSGLLFVTLVNEIIAHLLLSLCCLLVSLLMLAARALRSIHIEIKAYYCQKYWTTYHPAHNDSAVSSEAVSLLKSLASFPFLFCLYFPPPRIPPFDTTHSPLSHLKTHF